MPAGASPQPPKSIAEKEWCEGWRLRAYQNRRDPAKPPLHNSTPSLRQVGVDRTKLLARVLDQTECLPDGDCQGGSLAADAQKGLLPAQNLVSVAIQQHAISHAGPHNLGETRIRVLIASLPLHGA